MRHDSILRIQREKNQIMSATISSNSAPKAQASEEILDGLYMFFAATDMELNMEGRITPFKELRNKINSLLKNSSESVAKEGIDIEAA